MSAQPAIYLNNSYDHFKGVGESKPAYLLCIYKYFHFLYGFIFPENFVLSPKIP